MRRHILLIEAWRLQVLILEGRLDFLKQNFLPRINQMLESGTLVVAPITHFLATQEGATEAEKLFNFVLSCDPDPVKKNSQWLFTQILRKVNPMPLEDLEGASETLARYAEMKRLREIPANKSDINAFKSLSELYSVVRGEEEAQVAATDAEEQTMLNQSDVLVNNAQLLCLIPKTQAAACYFGRNTEWCTAWGDHRKLGLKEPGRHPTRTNQFEYYSSEDSLYIIYEKQEDKNWQLHFHYRQFMDSEDRQFNIVPLIQKYPVLFKAIGEEKFIPLADKFGLSAFSSATIAKFPDRELARFIKQKDDLKLVPNEKIYNLDFLKEVLYHAGAEAVKWFPQDLVIENAQDIAEMNTSCFRYLPSVCQTQELANRLAESLGYLRIEKDIPKKFWTQEITEKYWSERAIHDNRLKLSDVPEQYRNNDVIIRCLTHNPEEIKNFTHLVDEKMAIRIMRNNLRYSNNIFKYLPDIYFTKEMCDAFTELSQTTRNAVRGYVSPDDLRFNYAKFPIKFVPTEGIEFLIDNGKLAFKDLPDQMKTHDILIRLVLKNENEASKIPHEYWTEDFLSSLLQKTSGSILKYIKTENVPEQLLAKVISEKPDLSSSYFYSNIPDKFRYPAVIAIFIEKGIVPISQIPKNMLSEDAILKRLESHPDNANDIPEKFWTPRFALRAVLKNPMTIRYVPKACYTEVLLYGWLKKTFGQSNYNIPYIYHYDNKEKKKIFNKFPKDMWSSRVLALAVQGEVLEPNKNMIPDHLINRDVAQAIISKNHKDVNDLMHHLDDEAMINALGKNWQLLKSLSPDKITEPMAFSVMQSYAKHASNHHRSYHYADDHESPIKDALLNIPKDVWSKRVYAEAVGNIVTLKDVPSKWRDTDMIKNAIVRDPTNVKFLKNPADWLNTHLKSQISGNGHNYEKWVKTLEAFGIAIIKKQFVDVSKLEKEPLPNGGSVAVVKTGSVNKRIYYFDKKGKYVFYIFTNKNKVEIPSDQRKKAESYRDDLLSIARLFLRDFEPNDLNALKIYRNLGNIYKEEDAAKQNSFNMDWTRQDHYSGLMYVVWNNNKPVLRFSVERSRGAFGNSGTNRIQNVEIYNIAYCLEHSQDIATWLNNKVRVAAGGWYDFKKIGIYFDKEEKAHTYRQTEIGTIGNYKIFKNDENKIALFGDKGLIGNGLIRAKGNIDKIEDLSDSQLEKQKVQNMFTKISQVLMKNKSATQIHLENRKI